MSGALVRCCAAAVMIVLAQGSAAAESVSGVPILVYHRFGPTVADGMTVTTPVFESHIAWLREKGYSIVQLRAVVAAICAKGSALPDRSVAITADDGHASVYREMFPIIKRERIPVTLFVYPSAISTASYAMGWEEIAEMQRSGLVEVQSHTFWHPNFRTEKARLSAEDYRAFVDMQLTRSKDIIARRLGVAPPNMLAWAFGIHDAELEAAASRAGYVAAFSIDRHPARAGADCLALPRYLMRDSDRGARFAAIMAEAQP